MTDSVRSGAAGDPTSLIDRIRRLDSPLARRNPTVKFAVLAVTSLALILVFDAVTPLVLYVLTVGALIVTRSMRPRVLVTTQAVFAAFALGIVSANVFTRPGEVLWQAGILRVTVEGLEVGIALGIRTLLMGLLAMAFIVSTDPVRLMTSLNQHARLSIRVSSSLLAGYRLLQTIDREWQAIRHAHLVRAPRTRSGRPRLGARGNARAAFGLLVAMIRRGERIAQSLEQRGLGRQPRTVWKPVPLDRGDALFASAIVCSFAAVIAVSAFAGVLRGPAALFG